MVYNKYTGSVETAWSQGRNVYIFRYKIYPKDFMEQLQLGFSDSTQKPASDRTTKWNKMHNYN